VLVGKNKGAGAGVADWSDTVVTYTGKKAAVRLRE